MRRQAGFTLIELVTVIVILGILAAFALPRFAGLEGEARRAAINGLAGSVRSGAALAHALQLANANSGPNDPVVMEGATVTMQNGYPDDTSAGITATLQDISGFNDDGAGTLSRADAPGNCQVQYVAPANVGEAPTITVDDTGC